MRTTPPRRAAQSGSAPQHLAENITSTGTDCGTVLFALPLDSNAFQPARPDTVSSGASFPRRWKSMKASRVGFNYSTLHVEKAQRQVTSSRLSWIVAFWAFVVCRGAERGSRTHCAYHSDPDRHVAVTAGERPGPEDNPTVAVTVSLCRSV